MDAFEVKDILRVLKNGDVVIAAELMLIFRLRNLFYENAFERLEFAVIEPYRFDEVVFLTLVNNLIGNQFAYPFPGFYYEHLPLK